MGAPVIALDARLVGYAAGIARYATLLADALAATGGPEQYVILRGRRARQTAVGGPMAIQRQMLTPPHHRLERWTLPLEIVARRPMPSLLHSLDHVAPAWGPWRSVVIVVEHDEMTIRAADHIITDSHSTRSDAIRLLGLAPESLTTVHLAASDLFRPIADHGIRERTCARYQITSPFILSVCTLEPRKNVPLLLEAFGHLRQHVDAQLLLVGARGWLDEPIFQAHARSGVGDAARFLGTLGEADLAVLYSHAGVFVLPSVYEGFGLPVLEAMACGAPVVCSNAGPLPEVAGDAAVLLPPRDPALWARVIREVLIDPSQAAILRQRGFARAKEFSWQGAAQATREVYREALLA